MREQRAVEVRRISKELTPVKRFLMRMARLQGRTHRSIAKAMNVSLQTVHAQTKALGFKPTKDESERSLQLEQIRQRFALESGIDLEGDFGGKLWKVLSAHINNAVRKMII